MTYDDHPEICELAQGYQLELRRVPMKNTHHTEKHELLIGRDLSWLNGHTAIAHR
jgi:DNA adenine methylase